MGGGGRALLKVQHAKFTPDPGGREHPKPEKTLIVLLYCIFHIRKNNCELCGPLNLMGDILNYVARKPRNSFVVTEKHEQERASPCGVCACVYVHL